MSNTYIAPGKEGWKLADILEEMKDGVYLLWSRGGQVSTVEGVCQFKAKLGCFVRGGKRTSLLRIDIYIYQKHNSALGYLKGHSE